MTLDEEMTEFFRRSVAANTVTGIPRPFDIQWTEQTFVQPRRVVEDEVAPRVTLLESNAVAPPVPTIDETLHPNNGRLAGGSTIDIVGTGFIPTSTVFIDNVPATNVVVNEDKVKITCKTPAYTHGVPPSGADAVDVKVINVDTPNHFFQVIKVDGFNYYVGPGVSSLSPNHGPGAGGTAITVTGTNYIFGSGYGIRFDTTAVPATRINNTTLTCIAPSHAAGVVNITVIAPDADHQVGGLVGGYTYDAPGGPPVVGGPGYFSCNPTALDVMHNGTYTLQWQAINPSGAGIDTTYNGLIHPYIWSASNATITFPATVNMVNGIGSFQVQVFLVNLHARGEIYLNCTENIINEAEFSGYIAQFFNP